MLTYIDKLIIRHNFVFGSTAANAILKKEKKRKAAVVTLATIVAKVVWSLKLGYS